jgi:hypothetical protein
MTLDSTFPGKAQDDDSQQNHNQRPNDHPATRAPARAISRSDPLEEPFVTFWEWSSPEDAEDYADL